MSIIFKLPFYLIRLNKHPILPQAIFKGFEWSKEKPATYCPCHVRHKHVATQVACQGLCEAVSRSNCLGIAYSRTTKNPTCFLCKNDRLVLSGDGFGFYRRPRKFQIVLLRNIFNL